MDTEIKRIPITFYQVEGPLGIISFAYEHLAEKYARECNSVVKVVNKMWPEKE